MLQVQHIEFPTAPNCKFYKALFGSVVKDGME